jgi:hypothetical protein
MRADNRGVIVVAAAAVAGLVLAVLGGCMPESDPGGALVPDVAPETFLTGEPPTLLESAASAHFYWTGDDPDGEVVGFQWKLCEIGDDGIGAADTLTRDPVTGQDLHPWHFTAATDTVLVVSATHTGFPGDEDLPEERRRNYGTHVFLVRAVDQLGVVDPTPAMVSFTAVTLVPRVVIDRPVSLSGYRTAQGMAPSIIFGWTGYDHDSRLHRPTAMRYLWKRALHDGEYVNSKYVMDQIMDELVSFQDTAWSEWQPYDPDPEHRLITILNQPVMDDQDRRIYYVFAIQVRDTTGAVSQDRTYGRTVHNVWVNEGYRPHLTAMEWTLGTYNAVGTARSVEFDVAPGQELNFSWFASADAYGSKIDAYRYGWDVRDPDDETDPGWVVPPGTTWAHLRAPTHSFESDSHTLTVQCWDLSGNYTRITFVLNVVPVLDLEERRPVLLVDDVVDNGLSDWRDITGDIAYASDRQRDLFWEQVLSGSGGVLGFDVTLDVWDMEDSRDLSFRDVVDYRLLLWTSNLYYSFFGGNYTIDNFRPAAGTLATNWLANFQESLGNVFLVGDRCLNMFIESRNFVTPIIFDTLEFNAGYDGFRHYYAGFGTVTLPSGETVPLGRHRYPYQTYGVAMLDVLRAPYNVYGTMSYTDRGSYARNPDCLGMKALIMDPDFKATYVPDAEWPDTIYADPNIDWRDNSFVSYRDQLQDYPTSMGEVYDSPLSERPTFWSPVDCDGAPCVDPMFRIYSRLDWVTDIHISEGDMYYPWSTIFDFDMDEKCGRWAYDSATHRSVVDLAACGFLSHKLEDVKPGGRGDVVWGFDPSFFDREHMKTVLRWVLGQHYGLVMRP